MDNKILNLENYPAINNVTGPAPGVSSRYAFVPTTKVIQVLADYGWFPSFAKEKGIKSLTAGYQTHLVRLRNADLSRRIHSKEYHPEILLKNNHCRTGSFELGLGIWRMVCSNGLVAGQSFGTQKIRHAGYAVQLVEAAIEALVRSADVMIDRVERFQSVNISTRRALDMAKEAIELKFNSEERRFEMAPEEILVARRDEDRGDTLWQNYNRMQENLIKGGGRGRISNGRARTDRPINALERDIKLNRELWDLAERYAVA